MHIVQIHHEKIPVKLYGGTERVVENLCKGYLELGHKVTLICYKGDYEIPGVNFIDLMSLGSKENANDKFLSLIPEDADVVHFHVPIEEGSLDLKIPYVCTLHGNEEDAEKKKRLPKNLIGVSENHANRHGSKHFVYNGLDFRDIEIGQSLTNRESYSFLGRASLKRKGLHLAKKVSKYFKEKIIVGGGRGISFGRTKYLGHLNDSQKYDLLRTTKALLFPIQWEEPFGLVMIEAMAVGTPVFAIERGSVSEVLGKEGADKLFIKAKDVDELISKIESFDFNVSPQALRDYVDNNFSYMHMCKGYIEKYELAIKGEM